MTTIRFSAKNQQAIARVAQKVRERVAALDYTGVMRSVTRDLEKLHGQYFDAEAGPAGSWPALSPRTIAKKGFADILWETGRLRESLETRTYDSIRELSKDGSKTSLKYGTIRPFAGLHQRGASYSILSTKATVTIPQRVHVGITEAEAKVITKRVLVATVRQLQGQQKAQAA